ncbi:MAG: NAD(P)/FAD-dependent oxidoreductase [Planctomycetes bacterium]|nr:NAD(P)/FAD-dependent oxidoreductase [Planctomycetota bacterium]
MNESRNKPLSWAVVGGGFAGIRTAMLLAQRGEQVTLIEAAAGLGGLASPWSIDHVEWDRFYHVILLSDRYLRSVLKELRLDDEISWVQTKTGFLASGKLHSLSSSIDFLFFPVLNWLQKFRLGMTIFAGSKIRRWKPLEKILVEDWLRKWSGDSTFEKIWRPLLQSKLGDAYQRTNASFIWAYIQRMYSARRSGLKREMFGYVPGGYRRIIDALGPHLDRLGVNVQTGTLVQSVSRDKDGRFQLGIESKGGKSEEAFDRVVLTTPSSQIASVTAEWTDDERNRLTDTEYLGVICTSLLLDRPLAGYYVTNLLDPGIPFTGIIEMGAILPMDKLNGNYLVYLPRYLMSDDPGFHEPDSEIHTRAIQTLKGIYPGFQSEWIRGIRTARAKSVMALPTLDYSNRRMPVTTSIPGVYCLNSARIVEGTLNVNEVIRMVDEEFESGIWSPHLALRDAKHA